ncbi:Pentatricopeptide repeat-containing protein [Thalictrum thalictroides]|uniref:Pentatricopeptide repeat-containing protein n=1 Tax=Thalictrum thalictroides TaxID=46969 RepID=A0A7J6V425_THATH|nr:Pentatricopeptide repeat-containing protein [Thalictrum thalictroides]
MAIHLFNQLQWETQHRPDPVTMISVTQASATGSANHGGAMMHCLALKFGFQSETLVANSLIDAYAKNGLIHNAWSLFEQMGKSKDNSSWNVMLAGLGMNGYGGKACALLSHMEEDGYEPNSITFVSLLSSCSHSGLIDEGCYYFNLMVTKYNIQPCLEHWTCIIDMFGRAGRLEEAYHMIQNGLPQEGDPGSLSDCAAVWGALLSACRMHVNVELGELASQQLSRLSPHNCGYYTLLSNLYSSGRRWDEAANMRRVFDNGKLMKKPGFSAVNV